MREELDDSEPDVFLESFVDVLSCGLGAALLLFLVFATLPRGGGQAEGAEGSPVAVEEPVGHNPNQASQLVVVASGAVPSGTRLVFSAAGQRCRETEHPGPGPARRWQFDCFQSAGPLPACVQLRVEPASRPAELTIAAARLVNGVVSSADVTGRAGPGGVVVAVRTDRPTEWLQRGGHC